MLIEFDQAVSIFEYALQGILLYRLDPVFFGKDALGKQKVVSSKKSGRNLQKLLYALCYLSNTDAEQAQHALTIGCKEAGIPAPLAKTLPPARLSLLDGTLQPFVDAAPSLKERVLRACAAAVSADGVIQPAEAELLRAIADGLGCPMPPLAASVAPTFP